MSDLDLASPYDPDQFKRPPAAAKPAQAGAPPPAAADEAPVPWKAAASSIPRLRQQPAALPEQAAGEGEFPGFAQDAIEGRGAVTESWEREAGSPTGRPSPLSIVPSWEVWLERLRAIPPRIAIGAGVAVIVGFFLIPVLRSRAEGIVSLGRIRQHPEAFDGRIVKVRGKAGETFTVGGSFVFNLRQGRDTIVVYSRARRPALHETVRATGIVSIGYLDGAPRVALFEQEQPTP